MCEVWIGRATESERGDGVRQRPAADSSDMRAWRAAARFDDFAASCCGRPHLHLTSDPDCFALRHRATITVALVAHPWGLANLGRFAAIHRTRCGEPPLKSLPRRTFRVGRDNIRCA